MNAALLLCGLVMACMAMYGEAASSCSGKWAKMPKSTMCRYSRPSSRAKNCGVSEKDKKNILDIHNRLRAGVSPTSSNMLKMYWNDDLAALAQQWATQCRSAHDTNENRQIPDTGRNMLIGQSWASGHLFQTWQSAIEGGWYREVKNFKYGRSKHTGITGHFLQIVQGPANLIGCGYCDCPQGPHYICNYYRGNSKDKGRPYIKGPKACKTGLCDCGDLLCKNNGTLNAETCKCDCSGKYTGKDCSVYQCPPRSKEHKGCGKWHRKSGCNRYSVYPDMCPYMCGLCSDGKTPAGCDDTDKRCPEWAKRGDCKKNPKWMSFGCKKSCNAC